MNHEHSILWNANDIGCYADGANGEDHRRAVLGDMLRVAYADCPACKEHKTSIERTIIYLSQAPTDDYGEEDDAIDLLNNHCAEGIGFLMYSGDLVLTDSDFED